MLEKMREKLIPEDRGVTERVALRNGGTYVLSDLRRAAQGCDTGLEILRIQTVDTLETKQLGFLRFRLRLEVFLEGVGEFVSPIQ